MTQRLSYNYEYSAQREKAAKMNQIEGYVMILIENNKNYADQLNILRKDNTDLRGKLEVMMGEMLKNKESFEDSLASTKASYAKEIGALINELKDILHQKEQMEASYKSLLEEISYQSEYDKSNRAIQLNELERNYENKIKILNDRILEQNKQLQVNFYSNSDCKIKMVKEIDALRFEIGELKKENNDLHQGQAFLENQLNRQSVSLKQAVKEKEEMGVNLLKLQQQKNQSIIELKQSSTLLREQINDHIESIKKMQVSLITKQKQYQNVYQRFLQQQGDRQEYEDAYHKLSSDFAQRQAELTSLRIQYNKLNDSTSKEIKRLNDLANYLEADNAKYCEEKQQLESANLEKQGQVYTLLERIRAVQREYDIVVKQLNKVEEQVVDYSRRNQELTQQLQITLLEQKKASEKCMLQSNHIDTLEKLLEKQKRRTTNLQLTSGDRQSAYSKQLSIQNQVMQRYQFQMQSLLHQKTQIINKFQSQKDRLIRTYETALREKEMTFKQKIRFLENEIIELSK